MMPDRVLVAGDWHGNTLCALDAITAAARQDATVVVQLGDFGFWTPGRSTDRYLDAVHEECARHKINLLWIDGNHECFPALGALPVDPDTGLRRIRPNLFHLPRGVRWIWHGRTWMALGGAHSVDRQLRVQGKDWWPEEFLSEADLLRATTSGPVDVLLTHDCPDRVDIPGLAAPGVFPAEEIAVSEAHRWLVGQVVDATTPAVLLHGHYHVRYDAIRELPAGGNTAIIGLADDSATIRENTILLDLADGELPGRTA